MKMSGGPASINLKLFLLVVALVIAAGTLYYTQTLVKKLHQRERNIVELYAKGFEYIANSDSPDADLTFLFDNIIKPIDFPIILTDKDNNFNPESNTEIKNVDIDSTLSKEDRKKALSELIIEMDAIHKPINITYADTIILQRIHFGESNLVKQLKFYPYIQIIIAALFILIGYIGFSQIKRSEQSNIWVGMAKETAHQFGTPISSLMGWIEMMKLNYEKPDAVLDITEEISSDVEKLNKITYRFSKIGSKPEIKDHVVYEEAKKVTEYFNRRLPQTGKTVELVVDGNKECSALINQELFEWVLENLIKNSLDAIENKNGLIRINIIDNKNNVEIEVSDNGKGIDLRRRKDVFRPGYSTKKRGWGLGLSLSKRIIEGYHGGKISVKSSTSVEGTTFKIILRKKH
ncbi:MAG: two-component sensor histidine kinase [Ignavibacteriales bacterium UTCHB2]|jgi:signal transduction histidine kinase|nr:MAG: C4-dicarboxylate transport sensor protein DctB [Ignavibacteria bacterium ADurb.Bin266]OQY71496.1 MAG: two-component sensor histidine kinase [Ignavibacteriales bacterium UTCHB2]HQI40209.1 HAMP domain-containing sensor histidine kinase [Ignavibacteriaceae bacterium]